MMQIYRGLTYRMHAATPMFAVQPLTQPVSSVIVHRSIGSADRAKAEIIASAAQGSIQVFHHLFH